MKNKKNIIICTLFTIVALLSAIIFSISTSMSKAQVNFKEEIITSKLDGQIEQLNIQINSEVKKGEILAQLKQEEFQKSLDAIQKEYNEIQKTINENNTKIQFTLSQANNNLKNAKTKLENANNDYVIYKNFYKDGAVTKKDLDKATKNLELAKENYENVQKNIILAKENIEKNKNLNNENTEKLNNLVKELEQKQLDLSYTTFIAPFDGTIKSLNVKSGDNIKKEQNLMTISSKICSIEMKNKKNLKQNQKILVYFNLSNPQKGTIEKIENNKVYIKLQDDSICANLKDKQKIFVKIDN